MALNNHWNLPGGIGKKTDKHRLELFGDGVFAIELMLLELKSQP